MHAVFLSSCWWQQQGWCRDANCYFSWSVCSKQKLFLLLWQKLKWEKIIFCRLDFLWQCLSLSFVRVREKHFARRAKQFHIWKWISFPISNFDIIEEIASALSLSYPFCIWLWWCVREDWYVFFMKVRSETWYFITKCVIDR